MKKIKPAISYQTWMILSLFIICSIVFYLSPYRDMAMSIASIICLAMVFMMLWMIDYSHMVIHIGEDNLKLIGYFNVRNIDLNKNIIDGYEICQKIDQIEGAHDVYQIVIKNKKVLIPKVGYSDEEYGKLGHLFNSEFDFLGYKPIKYGEFLKKFLPVMFFISGILAGLVGLLKLLNW